MGIFRQLVPTFRETAISAHYKDKFSSFWLFIWAK